MAWTDLTGAFTYGSQLTSAQMQQLRDNITAAFNADSGAPSLANNYIQTAMVANGQITSAKMDTGLETDTIDVQDADGTATWRLAFTNGVLVTATYSAGGP